MAYAQKPDFVYRRNGRVHLNRLGRQFSRLLAAVVRISRNNAGYTMFLGSVKGTGYPLHSPVSSSLPLPCVTVRYHISTGLCEYLDRARSQTAIFRKSSPICYHCTDRAIWAPHINMILIEYNRTCCCKPCFIKSGVFPAG